MLRKFLFLSLIFFSLGVSAQTLLGKVVNAANGEPLPYVNIGIRSKSIGTVCDFNGAFRIQFLEEHLNDTLTFSCIGYQTLRIAVSSALASEDHIYKLQQRGINLHEVKIIPKEYRPKNIGNHNSAQHATATKASIELGNEFGVMLRSRKPAFVEKVHFMVAKSTYDTVFYRVNIYQVKEDDTWENIMPTPVYLSLPAKQVTEEITIDLKAYSIQVQKDFVVTLEMVKDLGKGEFSLCAGFFEAPLYFRETSQAEWEKAPMGIGIGINVDVLVEHD